MKKNFSLLGASMLVTALSLALLPLGASANGNKDGGKGGQASPPDNRPPDNRPPNCPGNSCKPHETPPPPQTPPATNVAVTGTASPTGTVSGVLTQNGTQKLSAEQHLQASNEATLKADQTQGDLTQKQGDLKQELSGSVKLGDVRGGKAITESGAITQNVGATAEGNSLKTGDNVLKDSGNATLESKIAVEGAKQQQEAKAINQGVTGNSVVIDNRPVRQAVPAHAPPIYQQGGCTGSSASGGVSGVWGGLSVGKTHVDKECQINAAETTVLQANQQIAYGMGLAARFAVRIRCKSELLGFTAEECEQMEKEVMAKFDADETHARKVAEANAERARLEAELAEARKNSTAKTLTTDEVTAAVKAALQLEVRVPTERILRTRAPCTKMEFADPKSGQKFMACPGSRSGFATRYKVVHGEASATTSAQAEAKK